MVNTQHDVGIHLDESAIAVIGETLVASLTRNCLHCLIIETEVQNRIHHARHGCTRTRSHRHEQWLFSTTEHASSPLGHLIKRFLHLLIKFIGIGPLMVIIGSAHFRRDRKTGRHWQIKAAHFSQVRAFTAEKVAITRSALCLTITECVHPLRHAGLPCAGNGPQCLWFSTGLQKLSSCLCDQVVVCQSKKTKHRNRID